MIDKELFEAEFAKACKKRVGEKYRPSNGIEGEMFMKMWLNLDGQQIVDLCKKHGMRIELGSQYSVRCQITQLINLVDEVRGLVADQPAEKSEEKMENLCLYHDLGKEFRECTCKEPPDAPIPAPYDPPDDKVCYGCGGTLKEGQWMHINAYWCIACGNPLLDDKKLNPLDVEGARRDLDVTDVYIRRLKENFVKGSELYYCIERIEKCIAMALDKLGGGE